MKNKSILNKLELTSEPITAYQFSITNKDEIVKQNNIKAGVYVLGQRPAITFQNIKFNETFDELCFEIHQRNNINTLKIKLPLFQSEIGFTKNDTISLHLNPINSNSSDNFYGFSLAKKVAKNFEFMLWLTPEKLLFCWWNKLLDCKIEGNYKSFLKYKVHYVGKATEQHIFDRVDGHKAFQKILSQVKPNTKNDIPSNEIVLLCFKIKNIGLDSFDYNSDPEEIIRVLRGESLPSIKTVLLDAEKALVKAMQPKYNSILFKKYPESNDGLFKHKYKYISYSLSDPIVLKYDNGEIIGSSDYLDVDTIIIKDNKKFILQKHKTSTSIVNTWKT